VITRRKHSVTFNPKKIALATLLSLVAYAGIYTIGYRNSLPKIDSFCGAINGSTMAADLPQLAGKFDVTLLGPYKGSQELGTFTYIAASAYTVGEYRCSVEATVEYVMRKTLPNGSKVDLRSFLDTDSIQIAVEKILIAKEERGGLAAMSEIQSCYQRVHAIANIGPDKADICIAQDIAYSYFSDPVYPQLAKQSGNSQVEIQTPFTQLDAVNRRVRSALSDMQISKQEAEERIARLTQEVHDSITPALKKISATRHLKK